MFKNYIKIAWRSLQKNKLQTLINILGLTVGTISCLTILLYVFDQMGYDQHHDHADSIYRVETIIERSGKEHFDTAAASPPIAFAVKEDFPEVVEATRIVPTDIFNINLIRSAESTEGYYEPRAYLADSTVFKVFTYRFIEGNVTSALNEPNSLVLSSSLAKKLFGNKKTLGKTVILGSGEDAQILVVKGVFDDQYGKSHLNPNYFVSMSTPGLGEFVQLFPSFATNNFVYSYVKLIPGGNKDHLESKLPVFIESHGSKDIANAGMSNKILKLQKATDIHLYSNGRKNQIDKVSNIKYLYFLLILAFFIQFVACINFINLSTARASKRAKEIGVRKVVGAGKNALMRQFLGESLLLSFFTILISIPITIFLLPFVNQLTQGSLDYLDVFNFKIGVLLMILGISTGLLAGIYPAIILTSIKPVRVLKNTVNLQSGNGNLRKALVVFQFVVSIFLITTVIIITQQFRYTQSKDLGFEKNNLIALRVGTDDASSKYNTLKSNFLNIPGVIDVASGMYAPSEVVLTDNGLYRPGGNPQNTTVVKRNGISEGYFKTMGIPLLQGRGLYEKDKENQIVVNKSALDAFDIKLDQAIGAKLLNTFQEETIEYEVVGVVNDYHFASLKDEIAPLFLYKEDQPNWLFLRTETKDYHQLLTIIEQHWKTTVNNVPFTYSFVDEEVEKLYEEEKRLGKISVLFTCLAILISCLGLFGLVSYVAEQKKKEIGIRKVLGASINSVIKLLTKDFVKLVIIAFVIASPIAYLFMQRWLEDYTYRIQIKWWVFILAGGFALVITIVTVGFQSIRSAIANPVKSLRTE